MGYRSMVPQLMQRAGIRTLINASYFTAFNSLYVQVKEDF